MRRPGFLHGVLIAAVFAFFASAVIATLTPFFGFASVIRLVIPALGLAYLPDHDVARVAGRLVIRLGAVVLGPLDLPNDPRHVVAAALSGFAMRFLAAPAGQSGFG